MNPHTTQSPSGIPTCRIRDIHDALSEGQALEVKCLGRDPFGLVKLSRKALLPPLSPSPSPPEDPYQQHKHRLHPQPKHVVATPSIGEDRATVVGGGSSGGQVQAAAAAVVAQRSVDNADFLTVRHAGDVAGARSVAAAAAAEATTVATALAVAAKAEATATLTGLAVAAKAEATAVATAVATMAETEATAVATAAAAAVKVEAAVAATVDVAGV